MKYFLQLLAFVLNKLPTTNWKPIHLCQVYYKYGVPIPNLVGQVSAPSLTTDATPSSITTTSAIYDTNQITATGGENATTRGICYVSGTGGTPTTSNTVVSTSGSYGVSSYSSSMTGLAHSTTYSVRAFATNSGGTGYGSTVEVTTAGGVTAPTVVQVKSASIANYDITRTVSFDTPVTSGNFLVLFVGTSAATADNVTTVSDTRGNTWVKIASTRNGGRTGDFWYVQSAIAGTTTVTIATTNYVTSGANLYEINGIASTSPVDSFSFIGDGAVTSHSHSTTTTNANDVIIGAYVGDQSAATYTAGSGFSSLTTANGGDFLSTAMIFKYVTTAGSQSASMTTSTSSSGNMGVLALKAGSVAPPSAPTAPTGVDVISGDTKNVISWALTASATTYTIRRSLTSNGAQTTVAITPSTTTYITDYTLTNGTQYFYKVYATNAIGESPASLEVSGTPTVIPTAPADWYSYGVKPSGITQQAIYDAYNAQANAMKSFTQTQTGMPTGMPAGAWRVSNPDQARFGLNGNDAPPGTITITAGSVNVTGVGTQFTKYLVGTVIEVDGQPVYVNPPFIASIQSDTQLTLNAGYNGITSTGVAHRVGGGTFSEGIAYGLIHNAYRSKGNSGTNPIFDADAKAVADGLITYYNFYKNTYGVAHWRINTDGTIAGTAGQNGATDADLDMAFGLLKMHEHHGSSGVHNYLSLAQLLITNISLYEFYSSSYTNVALRNVMTNGDNWNQQATVDSPDRYMMDYFRPGYFKAFGQATNNATRWDALAAKQYEKLNILYEQFETGLVPDESNRAMQDLGFGYRYGYNSIRMPASITVDFLWNGINQHPLAYLNTKRFTDFIRNKYGQVPADTNSEHFLDGTAYDAYDSVTFVSGYGVAGLVSSDSSVWAKDTILYSAANLVTDAYFGGWIGMNNLLPMTGSMKPYDASLAPTSSTKTHTTDSVKRKQTTISHTSDARCKTVKTFTMSSVMMNSTGGTTSLVLYNRTDATYVTGAEISTTSTVPVLVEGDFEYNATNFVTGKEYEFRLKASSGTASVWSAKLLIRLKDLTTVTTHNRVSRMGFAALQSNVTSTSQRWLYTAANYSSPTADWVVTGTEDLSGTSNFQLYNVTTTDSGVTGSGVGAGIDVNSTSKTWGATTGVSLVNTNRYLGTFNFTSGGARYQQGIVAVKSTNTLGSLKTSSVFELLDIGRSSTSTGTYTPKASYVSFSPNDYDGATMFFEVLGTNNHSSIAYGVTLVAVNSSGTESNVVTQNLTAGTGSSTVRYRTSSISIPSDTVELRIRIAQTAATKNLIVGGARIIINQVNALKTRIVIPMGGSNAESNDDTISPVVTTTNTSYAELASSVDQFTVWKRVDSNFATYYGQTTIPSFTKTHTTDVNKRVSGKLRTHTTSANKRVAAIARIHTTDALKRKQNVLTHTTSANRRLVTVKTHTTSANKRVAAIIRNHTTDAVIRRQNVLTHATDALTRKINTLSHTTDSNKRKVNAVIHTTSANKRVAGKTLTHTANALKRKQTTLVHTTDALKRLRNTVSHTTDALKRKTNTLLHTTDSVKRTQSTRAHTTDTFKRVRPTIFHTTDARPYRHLFSDIVDDFDDNTLNTAFWEVGSWTQGEANGKAQFFLDGSGELRVRTTPLRSLIGNSFFFQYETLLINETVAAFELLNSSGTMILQIQHVQTNGMVYLNNGAFTQLASWAYNPSTTNWLRFRESGGTYYVETGGSPSSGWTVRHSGSTITGMNNSLFQGRCGNAGANLSKGGVSGTIDNFNVGSAQFTRTHTTDALLRKQNTLTHTTSANKRRASTLTHTTDANKKLAGLTLSHTTSASKKKAGNVLTHTTNANKRIVNTRSHTTNASKRKLFILTHTTNSLLRRSLTLVHSTNSLLRKRVSSTHSTNSFKRTRNTPTHTTNSLKNTRNVVNHVTDALKRKTNTVVHTSDSLLKRRITAAHTTNPVKKSAGLALAHTTDAVKRKQVTSSHSTSANLVPSINLDQYQPSHALILTLGSLSSKKITQGFVPSIDGRLHKVIVTIGNSFESTDEVVAKIYSGALGEPDTELATSLNSFSGLTNPWTEPPKTFEFIFDNSLQVSSVIDYWIVLERTGPLDDTNAYTIGQSNSDSYLFGDTMYLDGLDVWTDLGDDIQFYQYTLVPATLAGTHSTSSFLTKEAIKTHTTDALKKQRPLASHTTSAIKRKEATVSHSTSSSLRNRAEVTHTTSSNKKKANNTVSHTTSANKRVSAISRTHTTNANKRKQLTLSHTTSGVKRKLNTLIHTTNSLKRTANVGSHTTSSILRRQPSILHTTDSILRRRVTATHTTNANKRKAGNTLSHTTSANKRVAGNVVSHTTSSNKRIAGNIVTHTTNALKRKINAVSHTANSLLRKTATAQHTTSANKRRVNTLSHTTSSNKQLVNIRTHNTDSNKRELSALSHSTNALKRTLNVLTHTTSSVLRRQLTRTHTTDALKRKQFSLSHTTNSNKRKATIVQHTTSALKRAQNTRTHTTDTFKKTRYVLTHTTNSVLRRIKTASHTVDSYLRGVNQSVHTTDANKRKALAVSHTTSSNKRVSGNTVNHTTDANKRKALAVSHSTDALLRKAKDALHTTDANKRKATVASHTTSSLVRSRQTVSHTTDTIKRAAKSVSHSTNSLMRKANTVVHTTSANLRKQKTILHTTNANKRKVITGTHTTSANKRKFNTRTHTTSSSKRATGNLAQHTTDVLKRTISLRTHTTNAVLRSIKTLTHTIDTLKRTLNSLTHTTDSNKRKPATVVHTTDSLKRGVSSVNHTTNSLFRKRVSLSHSTNSNKKKLNKLVSHFADAFKRGANEVTHNTDANKKRVGNTVQHSTDVLKRTVRLLSHTTNALLREVSTASHTTSSNKRKLSVLTHTTNANKRKANILAHTTSSIKRRVITVSHSTNSLLRKISILSHSTDSHKRRIVSVTHTTNSSITSNDTKTHSTDSNKRKALVLTHTTNALRRKAVAIAHSTDSYLRERLSISHSTNSFLRKARTIAHSTSSAIRRAKVLSHTTSSIKRALGSLQHATDAVLKQRYTVDHSTDSYLRKSVAVAHTTDSNKRKDKTLSHSTDSSLGGVAALAHSTNSSLWSYRGNKKVLIDGVWEYGVVKVIVGSEWKITTVKYLDTTWHETEQ